MLVSVTVAVVAASWSDSLPVAQTCWSDVRRITGIFWEERRCAIPGVHARTLIMNLTLPYGMAGLRYSEPPRYAAKDPTVSLTARLVQHHGQQHGRDDWVSQQRDEWHFIQQIVLNGLSTCIILSELAYIYCYYYSTLQCKTLLQSLLPLLLLLFVLIVVDSTDSTSIYLLLLLRLLYDLTLLHSFLKLLVLVVVSSHSRSNRCILLQVRAYSSSSSSSNMYVCIPLT